MHCVQPYFDSTPIVLSYIFYWIAVTHVSAVFNQRCCNGSRWLFNFRRPSIRQSSASPRVLRLLSLRCRFVPSNFCVGLQSAWSNRLCIDFFFATPCPPLLQSKSTSIRVHHILRLRAYAQNKNKLLCQSKTSEPSGTSQSICTRTFRNFTEYLHRNPLEPHRLSAPEPSGTSPGICTEPSRASPGICTGTLQNLNRYLQRNPPEPSGTLPGTWCWSCTGSHRS